jgi:hypothetical protein
VTRDDGHPISRGRPDPHAADEPAVGNVLWFVALFTGIAGLQELGVWSVPEATPRAS